MYWKCVAKRKILSTKSRKMNQRRKTAATTRNHDSYTFQAFKWTRIQVFHDNNRDFKSRTLFVGGERCPVALFQSFVERRPLLKHPCDGLFFFYLSGKRNRKFKHLVQTKPMNENTITNILKVSVAGTSLKESEKRVYESLCKKNNSQEAEESNLLVQEISPKLIRNETGRQCSWWSTGVIWQNLPCITTSLASAFWTLCNLSIWHFGTPYNRLLQ